MRTEKDNYLREGNSRKEMTMTEILVMVTKATLKVVAIPLKITIKITIWIVQVLIMTFVMLFVQSEIRNRKK
jgi:hypothetical protein